MKSVPEHGPVSILGFLGVYGTRRLSLRFHPGDCVVSVESA